MKSFTDTICAPITAAGMAAVSVIRVSGPKAIELLCSRFRPSGKLRKAPSHSLVHGFYHAVDGTALDEVLISKFIAPQSYTGEDACELSCHGNPRLAAKILEDLLLDCRMAEPGEFTRRAFQNGKLDLVQAEAVGDLITAPGSKASSAALSQLKGELTSVLNELLEEIYQARIRIELAIDFSDQDLPQIDLDAFYSALCALIDKAKALADESRNARFIREGIKLCLVGAPNAGKSSLFNAFLKQNRAIVSPHPGTTRDYLEESVSYAGYSLVIYDTAGLRDAPDAVEQIGISLAHKLMQETDLLLVLEDLQELSTVPQPIPLELKERSLSLITKVDLAGFTELPEEQVWQGFLSERGLKGDYIPVSVELPGGLDRLYKSILNRLELSETLPQRPLITNTRQLAALRSAIDSLCKARLAFEQDLGYEFIAFDLIEASTTLQEILGNAGSEDLLGRIFSDFCIGK